MNAPIPHADPAAAQALHELLWAHRSIRSFRDDAVDAGLVERALVDALAGTSSSGNLNMVSVVRTTDAELKRRLYELHGEQPMVLQAPLVLTFCADTHRTRAWLALRRARPGFADFIAWHVAAFDAMILAQSAALGLQAQGLGICYMGTTLYAMRAIAQLLGMPGHVLPVTTLVVGWPAEAPAKRDRLPATAWIHDERYHAPDAAQIERDFAERELRGWQRYRAMGPEVIGRMAEHGITSLAQFYTSRIKYDPDVLGAFGQDLQKLLAEHGFWRPPGEPPIVIRVVRCTLPATMLLALLLFTACSSTGPANDAPAFPETASGWTAKPGWAVRRFAVAAANPVATEAGYRVLAAGGSAVDAAVAVQMVLTLVEPQSSGIGGGALLMHWDGREVQAWDGRETAPAAASERLFLQPDGRPLPFMQAVASGLSVGVPGVLRMLEAAHRVHGKLPWASLFEPAIRLAEQGFRMGPRLHAQLSREAGLKDDARAAAYFYRADGAPHAVGTLMKNPAMAALFRRLAAEGADALYAGPAAADIVVRVHAQTRPGRLSLADLAGYRPLRREPLCAAWLARYRVCGFPPPSSGQITLMQILGLLERVNPVAQPLHDGVPGADWLHVYTEAARLAYADRNQYIADPDFVPPPAGRWRSLLDDAYLRERAALIKDVSMNVAQPGVPRGSGGVRAPQPEQPEHGTSHISIVDASGHALSMTTTIENSFGSRIMSDGGTGLPGGFLLNNELTDFSMLPADAQGRPIANRVQPGKRPRSSMSPTLVFDARSGRLVMSLGSPGGPVIIHFVAKTLIGTLQWGLDAQQAIDLPNFGSLNGPTLLEKDRFDAATIDALQRRGHRIVQFELTSGLQALQRTSDGWFGGADPRREGIVMGQ